MALVLNTGIDDGLLKMRRLILEVVGHTVINAKNTRDVEEACKQHSFRVAVIGQMISPIEKQCIVHSIRSHCPTTRILELYATATDRVISNADAWLRVPIDVPSELARVVSELAGEGKRSASAQ